MPDVNDPTLNDSSPPDPTTPPERASSDARTAQKVGFTSEKLNRIIAVCAILISGASFYATYLQAKSAEKQVQAMTLPLIQFRHGNFDQERQKIAISFVLENGGVGPAILKRVTFKYEGEEHDSMLDVFKACCGETWGRYQEHLEDLGQGIDQAVEIGDYSSELIDVIIPGQTSYPFQVTDKIEANEAFWLELNTARWELGVELCYCSLLDDCYLTDGSGVFKPIKSCVQN